MSIITDLELTWNGTIDSSNKIGVSKPLNQLLVNIFDDAEYLVGYTNKALKITKETNGVPHSNSPSNEAPWYLTGGVGYSLNTNNNPDGVYYRTILFAVPNNWSFGFTDSVRSNNNQLRIVTKLDLKKNKVYLTTTETVKSQLTLNPTIKVNESIANTTADGTFYIGGGLYYLTAADIYLTDNGYYIKFPWLIDHMYRNFNSNYGEGAYYCANYDIDSTYNYSVTCQWFDNLDWIMAAGVGNYYNIETWDNTELDVVPDVDNADIKFFAKFFSYAPYYWHCGINYSVEYALLMTACYGMYFEWNGAPYKPIIINGEVNGYTDDMTVVSDIDNWTDVTGHNISPVPPTPTGDITDKEHEMPLAYIGGTAGMVSFIQINKSGLASADDISEAISRFDISQIGKDLLRNFISFKAFAAITLDDTVDRQIKIAGIPLEDSGGNALTGRYIGGVKPIDLFPTSGGVTIPTLYNDYRDYEPYTKIQMYVPFCGWFSLPSWCIGKKITGTMFTDLYNGTVKAVIYASQTVVAEVGGCCAYDIPFVADATGTKAGAVISSALTTAAAVGATVAMPNVATGIAAVSSAANLAATLNGNGTTLKGVLGDGSNLNGLLHVYIKVSRPKSPNGSTSIPDSYKHEIGIPTMKEIKISEGDGYIQVMDAKVTGTMTAREKQMIVDGFRHGLNF